MTGPFPKRQLLNPAAAVLSLLLMGVPAVAALALLWAGAQAPRWAPPTTAPLWSSSSPAGTDETAAPGTKRFRGLFFAVRQVLSV